MAYSTAFQFNNRYHFSNALSPKHRMDLDQIPGVSLLDDSDHITHLSLLDDSGVHDAPPDAPDPLYLNPLAFLSCTMGPSLTDIRSEAIELPAQHPTIYSRRDRIASSRMPAPIACVYVPLSVSLSIRSVGECPNSLSLFSM